MNGTGVGTGSGSRITMVSLASVSAIGSNWLSVVNWKMGTVVPLAGVILTGGSVGSVGLLLGVSVQSSSSSMWFFPYCSICGFVDLRLLGCGFGCGRPICGFGQQLCCLFLLV